MNLLPIYGSTTVTEHFLHSLVEKYGRHIVYSDGGSSWYPEACNSLRLEHRLHYSPYEKSIIERAIEYVKDRTEQFDDCYPCRKLDCNLSHVHNWIQLFVFMHNGIRRSHLKFRLLMYLVGGDTSH